MATVITKTIGAAGDYTTPTLWDAGATTVYSDNLTGNDVIWKAEVLEKITLTGSWGMAGSTVDSTRYKWITAAAGQDWQTANGSSRLGGDISGAGFTVTAGSSTMGITLLENFCVVENLVLSDNSASSPTFFAAMDGADTVMRNCYCRSIATSSAGQALVSVSGQRSVFMNNIVLHEGTASADEFLRLGGGSSADDANVPVVANNTFAVSSSTSGGAASARSTAIERNGSNTRYVRVVNNAFMGMATLFTGASTRLFATDSGYNATQLADGGTDYTDSFPTATDLYAADITGTWSDANNVFVDTSYSTGDWRAYASGILAGAATRIVTPTHPGGAGGATQRAGTGDLDIYGNARNPVSPWIGAWEDAYSGSSGAVAAIHMLRLLRR